MYYHSQIEPPNTSKRGAQFLVSAGEASGELYGAQLIAALRRRVPDAVFFGVGGDRMRTAGCETVVDAHSISVVGLAEVVTHLPRIYGEFNKLVRMAAERRPTAAILIDFPDFNLRLAKKLHKLGIPVIYYVSPQLWAWRSGRIRQIQRYVQKMLVIFPFEEDWYSQRGVSVQYLGHPLVESPIPGARTRMQISEGHRDWIALLPGSRRKEVSMNLPGMLKAAEILQENHKNLEFVIPVAPSLNRDWLKDQASSSSSLPIRFLDDASFVLANALAAIVASGTATLEAALIGVPFVMVYRVSSLSWFLGKHLVKVPHYAMPNLIAGREVIPEFVQDRFTPQTVAMQVLAILPEGPTRQKMIADLAEVRAKLQPPTSALETVAERAAEAVLSVIPASVVS